MTFSLAQQTLVFLEAILLGVIGGFIYDICRAIRQILNFKTKGTVIIDLCFWLVLLIILFYFAVTDAVSQMRFYVILGEVCGMTLYFLSFTEFILPVLKLILSSFLKVIALPNKFVKFILSKTYIIKPLYSYIIQIIKNIKKRLSFFTKSG